MRKKAENKIRHAVEELDSQHQHRLDKVRAGAGLFPKVFDKTILDMERVGTIRLYTEGIEELNDAEISSLVRRGDTIYVSFNFIDSLPEIPDQEIPDQEIPDQEIPDPERLDQENQTPETIVLILQGLYPGEWEKFEALCERREKKTTIQKLEDMVRSFNNEV